jgi:hypothetical protein
MTRVNELIRSPLDAIPPKAGRPKVRTPDYLAQVLLDYERWVDGFIERHGSRPTSDVDVISDHVREQLVANCLRCGRLESAPVKARIKTLRNLLSLARQSAKNIQQGAICGTRNKRY